MADAAQILLFRFFLPLSILAACIVRFNALSAVYLSLLLCIPLLPSPGQKTASAVRFQILILVVSIVFILAHIIFQIIFQIEIYDGYFNNCTLSDTITTQVGFNRLDNVEYWDIIRLLAPDVLVFIASLTCVLACRNLKQFDILGQESTARRNVHEKSLIQKILPLFVALMLLLAGIMQPSILTCVYFLAFLVVGTCWAFHLSASLSESSWFHNFTVVLMLYSAAHIFLLYLYQMQFLQLTLPPHSFVSRLVGLPGIVNATLCSEGHELLLNRDLSWPAYFYPVAVFLLYWIAAVNSRVHLHQASHTNEKKRTSSLWTGRERDPLLPSNGGDQTGASAGEYGAVVGVEEHAQPVNVQGTFSSIMMFLMRQSYIVTLIIMMTWSITYHSWLSFVLLLWACLTWVTPFARKFCMASSPYLVIYSEMLLIIQYVYGMNLTNAELPVESGNLEYSELGLKKSRFPVLHLGAQTLFTWTFLVTLRQHMRERREQKLTMFSSEIVLSMIARPIGQAIRRVGAAKKTSSTDQKGRAASAVADMYTPLSTTPSDDAKHFVAWVVAVLSKYWILVCCAAFLLVALQNQVSLYQIFYMMIFLFGFVVYQFSARCWKNILWPLWWLMVIYSIIILLTIYTYQFSNMHTYWVNSTGLSDNWLYDIGLRQHTRAKLLVELLIPTIFSIIIVIQLHFFHRPLTIQINRLFEYRRKFMRARANTKKKSDSVSKSAGMTGMLTSTTAESDTQSESGMSQTQSERSQKTLTDDEVAPDVPNAGGKLHHYYRVVTEVFWRAAEIHIIKIVSFVVVMVIVQRVSAINFVLMVMLAIAMPSRRMSKVMNYFFICYSSIVVIIFMFYQLKFVKQGILDVNCTYLHTHLRGKNSSVPQTLITTPHFTSTTWWLGFYKSEMVSADAAGYLLIIMFIVFFKFIKHHQELYRFDKKLKVPKQGILIEHMSWEKADESLGNAVLYLCNHFFGLFGIEMNLIVMVLGMCLHSDVVAVLHSVWAALFLILSRRHTARIWPAYIIFCAVMLPLQYALMLGWPPGLCKEYPWSHIDTNLKRWFVLTDVTFEQNSLLLLADFFQLLAACCQARVFAEQREESEEMRSDVVFLHSYSKDGYIPPDFMGNKTWLDFLKIIVLEQFIWLTLSIVYVTAQNTTSLYNFGFILGCFFFLWHGQSLYLRPRTMVKWWKVFMGYNYVVLCLKLASQLVSCVYIDEIYKNEYACWPIQLLNLYCVRSANYDKPQNVNKECPWIDDTGLLMDSVCFIFLLVQQRIFVSSYFSHIVAEHHRQTRMATRGAELVEEGVQTRLRESLQRDACQMQAIKNMLAGLKLKLADLHPNSREPVSHYEAIYSGEALLFDTDPEEFDKIPTAVGVSIPASLQSNETKTSQPVEVQHNTEDTANGSTACSTHNAELGSDELPDETNTESVDSADSQSLYQEKIIQTVSTVTNVFDTAARSCIMWLDEKSYDYRMITQRLDQENLLEQFQSRTMQQQAVSADSKPSKIEPCTVTTDQYDSETYSLLTMDVDGGEDSWKRRDSMSIRFAVALYYAMLAHTDLLCYTLMIINHIYYACVLSMPLPFFVFLWGMLSIPRPSKRFWVAVITYVELVIVVKYVFQFPIFKFNECLEHNYSALFTKSPLCPPRILGIEQNSQSPVCDLLLLLACFFHRFALKSHGLWRDREYEEDRLPDTSAAIHPTTMRSSTPQMKTDSVDPMEITPELAEPVDLTDSSRIEEAPTRSAPARKKRGVLRNIKRFLSRILNPDVGTGAVDVYALMFGCQFIIFFIIVFSWSAFSSPASPQAMSNFATIIEENIVPKTFLYMVLSQFLLIVFDRYLYMRKLVFAKFLYLAVFVFLFHFFMFFFVPYVTNRRFVNNTPAIFLYFFQCFYFGLSAYQVRCGYPTRILGNFLTKRYTLTNGVIFQGIQAIPFLLELRSVLDWTCTPTTMTLNHWLKLEDIYANTYITKCWRDSEKMWPHPRGMRYWLSSKILVGGLVIISLIVIIWFPLLFMSFINSAYIENKPVEATFTLTIGGYQPLFHVTSQQQFLEPLSEEQIAEIPRKHPPSEDWDQLLIEQRLREYKTTGTIVRIKILTDSSATWTISPPSRQFLINDLMSKNISITLRFRYVITREPQNTLPAIVQETVSGVTSHQLAPEDPIRNQLVNVLKNPSRDVSIDLPNLFPSFIQVPGTGSIKPVSWLGKGMLVNCTIGLRRGRMPGSLNGTWDEWWELRQTAPHPMLSTDASNFLEVFSLNNLVPPLHLSFFANNGIIGLYVGFVWLIGKFVRIFFTSISFRIIFDEMPNVDRILKLCLEIYMVRESGELKLEEDLFALLIYLYRSPQTLIKWTKYKTL